MLYVTYRRAGFSYSCVIKNIWKVNINNVDEKYIQFMLEKAKEINVIINPHWLNIMNHKDHNSHLTEGEFKNKSQQWSKIRRQWNVDKFISEILKGIKEHYTESNRF